MCNNMGATSGGAHVLDPVLPIFAGCAIGSE